MTLLKAAITTLLACVIGVAAQNRSCGPFDLTSTAGQLFTSDDGYQFPGPAFTTLHDSSYYIDDEGTLTNDKFEPCTFTNAFQCGPHIQADKSFALTPPYGEITWRGKELYFLCPPQAVRTTGLPVSTWTASITSSPWPDPTEHFPKIVSGAVHYIEPWTAIPKLDWKEGGDSSQYCYRVSIQAPWCIPEKGDPSRPFPTWRDFPLPTPTMTSTASVAAHTAVSQDSKVMEIVMDAAAVARGILW